MRTTNIADATCPAHAVLLDYWTTYLYHDFKGSTDPDDMRFCAEYEAGDRIDHLTANRAADLAWFTENRAVTLHPDWDHEVHPDESSADYAEPDAVADVSFARNGDKLFVYYWAEMDHNRCVLQVQLRVEGWQ